MRSRSSNRFDDVDHDRLLIERSLRLIDASRLLIRHADHALSRPVGSTAPFRFD